MTGWNAPNAAGGDPGAVTILQGSTFCVSSAIGDLSPDFSHGWFHRDTRALSRWNLWAGGAQLEPLDVYSPSPHQAVFIGRVSHQLGRESTQVVERRRSVGPTLHEVVTVRNYDNREAACTLVLHVDADFADLFDVKGHREGVTPPVQRTVATDSLTLETTTNGLTRRVRVSCPGATVREDRLTLTLTMPPKGEATATFTAATSRTPPAPDADRPAPTPEVLRAERRAWLAGLPRVDTEDEGFERVLERCVRDLGALRISDPTHPGRVVVAAGAPWFMALFGRDSLLTSYMTLPIDRTLALGTLQTLAELQGSRLVAETDEEPGRILHEVRSGQAATQALGGASVYYGTADATPLFVIVLAELRRWGGLADRDLEQLMPHARRALGWVEEWGDRDGDGFVEYARRNEHGLLHQGWKDSLDGVNFADGTIAQGPIALAEVQGYAYRAWRDGAGLARAVGDDRAAARYDERADALRDAFNRRFWLDDRGWFAVALDGDKRPVDALASNMGHCLWSGIVDESLAGHVARHLLSPALFSGWGVRTLADGMGAYNPVSYHNGSVWPHDNAIIVEGLVRYGFLAEAQRLASALVEAAMHFGGRMPELFCGFARDVHPEPIAYPTSCSPQAWASASPLHLVRSLLRLDPDVPARTLGLSPALPARWGTIRVEEMPLGGGSLTFSARGRDVFVETSPASLRR